MRVKPLLKSIRLLRQCLRYAFTMRSKKLNLVAVLFLMSSALAAQQAATAPVVIHITDPSGVGVSHVPVRVIPAPDATIKMETDAKGQLALDLKPGGYAVFARASGFKPGVVHIDVAPSDARAATAAQTFTIALQLGATFSPQVSPASSKDDLLISAFPYHEPQAFSPADLKAMPHITVTIHNPHVNADETYSGVRLADLLGKLGAPLGKELHGEALANYVVAHGSDGYEAVFALAEIDPSFHPGEILVADTMDGKSLDSHAGPLKLVVTEDKRPARSVRNLTTIELKSAE
jgi:hypothetical protein